MILTILIVIVLIYDFAKAVVKPLHTFEVHAPDAVVVREGQIWSLHLNGKPDRFVWT
jgi:hypothetical protein